MGDEVLEPVDLTSAAGFEVEIPSHCRVTRTPSGNLVAEVWTRRDGCEMDAWNYALIKLPWGHG